MARWRSLFIGLGVAFGLCFISSCGSSNNSASSSPAIIGTQVIVSGLNSPLDIERPDDNSGRLFVVEQSGTIKIIQNGSVLPTPFLDISSKVIAQDEMGLLGVTFHPSFATNGKFYVNYVRNNAGQFQSVISEFKVAAANPNQADPASERILLTVDQVSNFTNHKSGQLAFGPDGFLYFGLGDGGSEGDPLGHGQNTQILLGKMMRIDVNSTSPGKQYAIPPDNPFVAGGGLPEIYAFGFRNPWRFSFDPNGRLFIADVGQDNFEEVDIVQKGGNYGWNIIEGDHCFNPPSNCNMTGLSLPIVEIPHPEAEAVIGGFVYHGTSLTGMQGAYIFGDLNGKIWKLTEGPPNTFTRSQLATENFNISSFGQDAAGELYVTDISGGRVLKLVSQ
ncbi:MAG TPA: PQQ-dependent sugar dehydrogenase [Candidatus Angelobacter sp.]|nr:PQQ-dependent sugar dehydrogenase [Candidatus Angelobacter sp.]